MLAGGTCSITASQSGSSTYAPASPVTQTFTVSVLTPTVTAVTPNSVLVGSPATPVSIVGTNFSSASMVAFTPAGGGTPVTISPTTILAAQIAATIPASLLTSAGTAEIAIVNGGTVLSNQVPFTISPNAATTLSLTSSANPSTFGHSITLTATLSPSSLTGKVTFYDGTTVLGTSSLTGGVATVSTELLASGARSLRAYYPGITGYAPATSNVIAETVTSVSANGFTSTSYSTVASPYAVAVGDLNNDGRPDIVTANEINGNLSILMGTVGGGFQTTQLYFPTTTDPVFVAIADFNGDGKPDMVTANTYYAYNLSVFLGNGNGTFQTPVNYSAGTSPQAVATGDFNGDGNVDLAVAGSSGVLILLGNGDGTFRSPTTIGYSSFSSIAVNDFDRDGKADLIAVGSYGVMSFRGNGDGTFQTGISYMVPNAPNFVVTADFNGDGKPDFAVNTVSGNSYQCSVLIGNGDGTFQTAANYISGGCSVAADVNGDGKVDLTDANQHVLYGAGDGTFLQPSVPYSTGTAFAVPAAAADFNGDGRTDLAFANTNTNTVNVLYGTSSLLSQTITFGALGNQVLGSSPPALSATASSGLPVTFTSYTSPVCTVSGATVTLVATGNCLITASQPGNATYSWAMPVTQSFTVSILTPTVTSVTPNTIGAFSAALQVTIVGTNFGTASTISFTPPGGSATSILPTTVQATQLVASIPPSLLMTVGTAEIAVVNGGTVSSNQVPFIITNAVWTTVSLASSANPSTFGHSIALTATVLPSVVTGKVTFYDGTTVLGTSTLSGGQATFATELLASGTRSLRAYFDGSAGYTAATSSVLPQTVTAAGATGFTSTSYPSAERLITSRSETSTAMDAPTSLPPTNTTTVSAS